jgi:3-deoxy-D-manno-octulosonic acid kinase
MATSSLARLRLGEGEAGGWPFSGRLDGFTYHLARPVPPEDVRTAILAVRLDHVLRRSLGQRGAAFVETLPGEGAVVIKEYLRGGLVRHVVRRLHLRRGATRPVWELRMLARARSGGVRVPEPLFALERGRVAYRGWLVTRLLEGARPLRALCGGPDADLALLARLVAGEVGRLVECGILHVDLHPGNVMVGPGGEPFLLDLDRAELIRSDHRTARGRCARRWRRAVEKHRLPPVLARAFEEALGRE